MTVRVREWKTGSGWQVDVIATTPEGREVRVRRTVPASSEAAAEDFEARIRSAIIEGRTVPNFSEGKVSNEAVKVTTFGQWAGVFSARQERKPASQKIKESNLRVHLVPAFGTLPLASISEGKIDAFARELLASGSMPKTIGGILCTLSTCLRTALKEGHLSKVPNVGRQAYRQATRQARYLSQVEAQSLVLAADGQWRTMLITALLTGLRVSELLALQWGSVDLKKGTLTVRHNVSDGVLVDSPKEGKITVLPLAPEAVEALAGLPRKSLFVFPKSDGSMTDYARAHRALTSIAARAGLENVHWHGTRHTFGTRLMQTGASPAAAMRALRHSSLTMTDTYSHTDADELAGAVAALPSLTSSTSHGSAHTKTTNAKSPTRKVKTSPR